MTSQPLEVRQRNVGPWQMNTYALVCPTTQASVLIDPGDDPDILQEMLAGTKPVAILLTHTHSDHIGALAEMQKRLNVPLYAHANATHRDIHPDHTLAEGDTFKLSQHTLDVFYTPGHIDDQICFNVRGEPTVIVGDTIFAGGPGRTNSHANFLVTLDTLRTIVLQWSDDSVCYPGHGPSFRLGDIRGVVEAFAARDHGDFFGDAEW